MNVLHGKITGLQEALREAAQPTTSPTAAARLIENTHRSLRAVIHSIDDRERPILVTLLMNARDALPEAPSDRRVTADDGGGGGHRRPRDDDAQRKRADG